MSATFSTQRHHRVPLATALAVAGVITAAAALGVAWQQDHESSAPADAPALRTPTAQDYGSYNYYHGPNAQVPEGHSLQSPPGGQVQLGQ